MTDAEFAKALQYLTDEQVNALSTYFNAQRAYIAHIDECDEDAYYISKCNAYDKAKSLGVPEAMMEVRSG